MRAQRDVALGVLARDDEAVGTEPHEPLAVAVGACRWIVSPRHRQRRRAAPVRDAGRRTRRCRRPRARARSAAADPAASCASQRCTAVSFAWRRAQNPAVLSVVHDHAGVDGSARSSASAIRSTPPANHVEPFRFGRRLGVATSDRRGSSPPRLDDRRDPAVQPSDVTEQVGDASTPDTTEPAASTPQRARPRRNACAFAADRFAVRRAYSITRCSRSSSRARGRCCRPCSRASTTGHALELFGRYRHEQLAQRGDVVVLDVEPGVPLPTRAGPPACGRGSVRAVRSARW